MAIARISFFLSFPGLRLRLQRGSLQILRDRQKNEASWSLAGLLHDIGDWNLMSQFSKSDSEIFSQTSVRYTNSKKFWCLNVRKIRAPTLDNTTTRSCPVTLFHHITEDLLLTYCALAAVEDEAFGKMSDHGRCCPLLLHFLDIPKSLDHSPISSHGRMTT